MIRQGTACQWWPYGCPETHIVDQAKHDSVCDFFCDRAVDQCWAQLRRHERMNDITNGLWHLFATTANKFKTLPICTSTTTALWSPSKSSPVLFESSACWPTTVPPTTADVNKYSMSEIRASSPRHAQSVQVLSQLQRPNHRPAEVVFMLGLTPPYLLKNYPFCLPPWLSNQWTDAEGGVITDAMPKFSYLEVHCDRGLSTVSVSLGTMVNLWLIWPANEHNKNLFDLVKDECTCPDRSCMKLIGTQLTDGIIVITDHTQALYQPSGYLSLVYTIDGGYLTGMSFSGREDLPSFVDCVERELKAGTDVEDLKSTLWFLLSTLERSLLSPDTSVVYSTASLWLRVMQAMKKAAERGLKWSGMPRAIHQTLIRCRNANKIALEQGCPCGQPVVGPFFRHFAKHRL